MNNVSPVCLAAYTNEQEGKLDLPLSGTAKGISAGRSSYANTFQLYCQAVLENGRDGQVLRVPCRLRSIAQLRPEGQPLSPVIGVLQRVSRRLEGRPEPRWSSARPGVDVVDLVARPGHTAPIGRCSRR